MKFFDSEEWVLSSAGGLTGEAFMARSGEHKLFIKRNSSPFLAMLSAEGIVPKLLWTQRTGSGDVLTAQRWTDGRVLLPEEMSSPKVAGLLRKIHTSNPLLSMMKRLGKKPVSALQICAELAERAVGRGKTAVIEVSIAFLRETAERVETADKALCHSDVNHNNWLLDQEHDHLYLVDWDQAVIADPAMDLAMLLYWYIEEEKWPEWLALYGWKMTGSLRLRLLWYMVAMTLRFMFWHQEHGDAKKVLLFEKDLFWLHDYIESIGW
ncbi:MAG: phosphotransferase family protein [Sporolactobacillus sp.]|jgi:thiamine kinase-like enzyme|nr:phosphotransferase family protein [Sporolactobacillus sp.]